MKGPSLSPLVVHTSNKFDLKISTVDLEEMLKENFLRKRTGMIQKFPHKFCKYILTDEGILLSAFDIINQNILNIEAKMLLTVSIVDQIESSEGIPLSNDVQDNQLTRETSESSDIGSLPVNSVDNSPTMTAQSIIVTSNHIAKPPPLRPPSYARLHTSPLHRNTVILKTPTHHDSMGEKEKYLQLKWEGLVTENKVPVFQEYQQTEIDLSLQEKLHLLNGKLNYNLRWHENHVDHIAIIILDIPYKPDVLHIPMKNVHSTSPTHSIPEEQAIPPTEISISKIEETQLAEQTIDNQSTNGTMHTTTIDNHPSEASTGATLISPSPPPMKENLRQKVKNMFTRGSILMATNIPFLKLTTTATTSTSAVPSSTTTHTTTTTTLTTNTNTTTAPKTNNFPSRPKGIRSSLFGITLSNSNSKTEEKTAQSMHHSMRLNSDSTEEKQTVSLRRNRMGRDNALPAVIPDRSTAPQKQKVLVIANASME
jgi:hypothetical protein